MLQLGYKNRTFNRAHQALLDYRVLVTVRRNHWASDKLPADHFQKSLYWNEEDKTIRSRPHGLVISPERYNDKVRNWVIQMNQYELPALLRNLVYYAPPRTRITRAVRCAQFVAVFDRRHNNFIVCPLKIEK
jgi:hypothetical protein